MKDYFNYGEIAAEHSQSVLSTVLAASLVIPHALSGKSSLRPAIFELIEKHKEANTLRILALTDNIPPSEYNTRIAPLKASIDSLNKVVKLA
jgi:orotidine-5'-phosphate decarboxylase